MIGKLFQREEAWVPIASVGALRALRAEMEAVIPEEKEGEGPPQATSAPPRTQDQKQGIT